MGTAESTPAETAEANGQEDPTTELVVGSGAVTSGADAKTSEGCISLEPVAQPSNGAVVTSAADVKSPSAGLIPQDPVHPNGNGGVANGADAKSSEGCNSQDPVQPAKTFDKASVHNDGVAVEVKQKISISAALGCMNVVDGKLEQTNRPWISPADHTTLRTLSLDTAVSTAASSDEVFTPKAGLSELLSSSGRGQVRFPLGWNPNLNTSEFAPQCAPANWQPSLELPAVMAGAPGLWPPTTHNGPNLGANWIPSTAAQEFIPIAASFDNNKGAAFTDGPIMRSPPKKPLPPETGKKDSPRTNILAMCGAWTALSHSGMPDLPPPPPPPLGGPPPAPPPVADTPYTPARAVRPPLLSELLTPSPQPQPQARQRGADLQMPEKLPMGLRPVAGQHDHLPEWLKPVPPQHNQAPNWLLPNPPQSQYPAGPGYATITKPTASGLLLPEPFWPSVPQETAQLTLDQYFTAKHTAPGPYGYY